MNWLFVLRQTQPLACATGALTGLLRILSVQVPAILAFP